MIVINLGTNFSKKYTGVPHLLSGLAFSTTWNVKPVQNNHP
jgi:hypothetical protein